MKTVEPIQFHSDASKAEVAVHSLVARQHDSPAGRRKPLAHLHGHFGTCIHPDESYSILFMNTHLTMGATPTYRLLTKSFKDARDHGAAPTAHYLLTDSLMGECPSAATNLPMAWTS